MKYMKMIKEFKTRADNGCANFDFLNEILDAETKITVKFSMMNYQTPNMCIIQENLTLFTIELLELA